MVRATTKATFCVKMKIQENDYFKNNSFKETPVCMIDLDSPS